MAVLIVSNFDKLVLSSEILSTWNLENKKKHENNFINKVGPVFNCINSK